MDVVEKGEAGNRFDRRGMRMSASVRAPASCRVYTPPPLARAMVCCVRETRSQRWLEPGCGRGVFLEAISACGVKSGAIVGVDLEAAASEADRLATVYRGTEFLDWSNRTDCRFDCVVGNPPFVAIRTLAEPLRSLAASVRDLSQSAIGCRANLWYAFLLQGIRLLRDGGHLAVILPAACEYADYSTNGRSLLTKLFDRVDLIRSRTPLFDSVQEGTAVLVCRSKSGSDHLFRRHEVHGLNEVIALLAELRGRSARPCPVGTTCAGPSMAKASDVFEVRLGGVTGDADYFVMSESERKSNCLPKSAMRPALSRSKHVTEAVIRDATFRKLKSADEKVWLFRPSKRDLSNASVRRYLRRVPSRGGCHRDRYKIVGRNPWYVTPLPRRVDGFVTGMNSRGLWLCMNEARGLTATNTLYVVTFARHHSRRQRYAWALSLLTSAVAKQVARSVRTYAAGLKKIEPGQIGKLRLPIPPSLPNAVSLYQKACKCYLRGDVSASQAIADRAICLRES
jgi:adenine-specific DNA-methyltransferase